MADTNSDDNIENVREFCGLLASVTQRLDTLSDAFGSFANHLAEVEGTTEQEWNQLAEGLRLLIQVAESTAGEVAGEVAALASAAGELAGERLGSVAQEIDGAEEGLDSHLRDAHELLTHRFEAVQSAGYEGAKAKLDAGVAEIESAEADLDQSATSATEALLAAQGQLDAAEQDLMQSVADASSAVDDAEGHLDGALQEAEAVDDVALATAGAESGQQDGLYAELRQQIETEAEKLTSVLTDTSQEVVDLLTNDVKELATDADSPATQAIAKWDAEFDGLDAALKGLETETKELPRLAADLEISKRKVAELDEVLNAMA